MEIEIGYLVVVVNDMVFCAVVVVAY